MNESFLIDTYFESFTNYVKRLNLEPKIESAIISKEFLTSNSSFYLYYPKLFAQGYKIDKETVDLLCIAGYLYYHSIMVMDEIIDEKKTSKYLISIVCQEESIKILTSIFGLNSKFWYLWNIRKYEYFRAVSLQKELYLNTKIEFAEYEILSDFKSSFGKVAIDSIFTLQNTPDKYAHEKFNNSHKFFSIGFQLFDDVNDFREDMINKQFNWAVYSLSKIVNFETHENKEEILYKLLFIKGVGQDVLKKSIENFEKAATEIKNLGNNEWLTVIHGMRNKAEQQLLSINKYIEELRSSR